MARGSEDGLTFLRLSPSNIDELAVGLSGLHQSVRGERRAPSYWRWCYLNNPLGKTNTIVAQRAGRVVGRISIVYLSLSVNGKHLTAGLMEGLSVYASERSWECLRGLLEMHMAESLNDGVSFGFGYNTRLTTELNERLGGTNLGRVPVYSGFLNVTQFLRGRSVPYPLALAGWLPQPLAGLKTRGPGRPGLSIKREESFGADFDELWSTIEAPRAITVVKDAAYLNWRYVKCPDRRYVRFAAYRAGRLEGLVVFRMAEAERKGYILELLARDNNPEIIGVLLRRSLREMKNSGTGLVSASFPAHSPAAAALRDARFKTWGARLWDMTFTVVTDRKKESCPELNFDAWDFSLGDWLYH